MNEANERNRKIIEEFRANGGKVGGRYEGKALVLLHTKGARSKRERINPVMSIRDGDRYVVIASKGGAPNHPDWYYNILADPLVTIETATEIFQARAAIVNEPDRSRLYEQMIQMMPSFADYRRNTSRVIPVIALTRVE